MTEIPISRSFDDSASFNTNSSVTQTAKLLGLAMLPEQIVGIVNNFE